MPEIALESIVAATPDHVASALEEETVILHTRRGIYYGLDSVGGRIWELLAQPRSVRELCDAILARYDVEPDRCEADLLRLLEELHREELIEVRGFEAAQREETVYSD